MEVPGQRQFMENDVNLCSFCEDYDITTSAEGFCVECEVFTCHKCFIKHKGRKLNQEHSLVKVEESKSAKATDTYDVCQQHSGDLIKHYCPTHDQVCCGECIVLHHNGCKLELVRDKAITFHDSSHLNDLSREIKKCIKQAQDSASLVENNNKLLSDLHEQFVRDIETFVEEIFKHVNTMKMVILNKGKDIMLKDTKRMDELNKEIDEFIAKISQQEDLFEAKRDQPNKLFVASISLKKELKESQKQLDLLKEKNTVTRYKFKRDQVLENILKERTVIGVITEQPEIGTQQHREVKHAKEDEKTHGQILSVQEKTLSIQPESDQYQPKQGNTPLDDNISKQTLEIATQRKETRKQDQTTIASPLLAKQLFCENLTVTDDILSYNGTTGGPVGIYVFNDYIYGGATIHIEVVNVGGEGSIGLAVVPKNYRDNLPGAVIPSVGYQSNGKIIYHGSNLGIKGSQWKTGDRIRCTISESRGLFQISFTHNGKEVDTWLPSLKFNIHFAIGMKCKGDRVKVIF